MTIRPYAPADWTRLCEIHDAARRDELAASGLLAAYLTLEQTAHREGLFDGEVYVYEREGRVLGFAAVNDSELTWLYVDPAQYRQGIGRALLRRAVEARAGRLSTEVLVGNEGALALYRSEGFRVIERVDGKLAGNEGFPASGYMLRHLRIAPVASAQHESLVDLLLELHAHYTQPPTATREQVRAHLLENLLAGPNPPCLLVASHDGRVVAGFAALHLMYSLVESAPESRRQCQLKELYVSSAHRSAGVGAALVRAAAEYALEHGCARLDWNVKASNDRGIAFYRSLGAEQVSDRLSYRLSRTALAALARGVV